MNPSVPTEQRDSNATPSAYRNMARDLAIVQQRDQLRTLNRAVERRNAQRRSHARRYAELRAVAKEISAALHGEHRTVIIGTADVETMVDKLDRVLRINKYAWRPDAPDRDGGE